MQGNKHRPYGELDVAPAHYEKSDFNPDRRAFLQSNTAALAGLYAVGSGAYADGVGDGYKNTQSKIAGSYSATPAIKHSPEGIDPVDVARLAGAAAVGASAAHDVLSKEVNGERRALLKISGAALVDRSTHALGKVIGENHANADAHHRALHSLTPPANSTQTASPLTTTQPIKGK